MSMTFPKRLLQNVTVAHWPFALLLALFATWIGLAPMHNWIIEDGRVNSIVNGRGGDFIGAVPSLLVARMLAHVGRSNFSGQSNIAWGQTLFHGLAIATSLALIAVVFLLMFLTVSYFAAVPPNVRHWKIFPLVFYSYAAIALLKAALIFLGYSTHQSSEDFAEIVAWGLVAITYLTPLFICTVIAYTFALEHKATLYLAMLTFVVSLLFAALLPNLTPHLDIL